MSVDAKGLEAAARAMIGDERFNALPGISTYLERKSQEPGSEWSDRDELLADLRSAIEAYLAATSPAGDLADADVVRTGDAIAKAFHAEHGEWLSQHTRSELARAALSAQERG